MRRGRSFAIAVFCLTLVLTLTDWRWLQDGTGPNYVAAMMTHNDFYPPSLSHRAKVLRQIEIAPPPAELPPGLARQSLAHPDEFGSNSPSNPTPNSLAACDPLYAFMSLQV